ncbi:hypothetical protein Prudu_000622 [Prunus dulcis]|uniref:Uncharacterized protein n=1 Tax=Prunus dulcis TaxID=3755 RepID=A0A4Y1QLU0_PRUDU|nr:hypothetical protein Prudu_000622 [Prunus dulcis]
MVLSISSSSSTMNNYDRKKKKKKIASITCPLRFLLKFRSNMIQNRKKKIISDKIELSFLFLLKF